MREERAYQQKEYLFDYQRNIIDDKSYVVIANMSRCLGKSYTLAMKILKQRPRKCVYRTRKGLSRMFESKIEEAIEFNGFKKYIDKIIYTDYKIDILYIDGMRTEIFLKNVEHIDGGYDLVLYDEVLPTFEYKASQHLSIVTINGNIPYFLDSEYSYHCYGINEGIKNNLFNNPRLEKLQEDIGLFKREFDILNEYRVESIEEEVKELDMNEWVEIETKKLMREFSDIEKENNTVRTRNDILSQIKTLKSMKVNDDKDYDLYFDCGYNDDKSIYCTIYCDGKISTYKGFNNKFLADKIFEIAKNKNAKIYGDTKCFGMGIADMLYDEGLIVDDTVISIFNANIQSEKGGLHKIYKQSYRKTKIK